ncbi:zinc finger protein 98-like isoform X2 [Mesocricetus auratus]|uniref:Zinc finger protein 98-like isoform X2 n=1 Tax=Mesocricetus auratus TaxID=10036 RepID=A0ABM2WIC4_MESAU|nr:zinc finger protein 98-like isoform X2 [Mesocricetus auratus]
MACAQSLLTFEDVAINFSKEEWKSMHTSQREMYRDVMLENYSHLVSVGLSDTKPELITCLEQNKEPWMENTVEVKVLEPALYYYPFQDLFPKVSTEHTSQRVILGYFGRNNAGELHKKFSACRYVNEEPESYFAGKKREDFKCTECCNSFSHRFYCQVHQTTQTGEEKTFMCEACGKSFTQSSLLHAHHGMLNGEKPYKYFMCRKSITAYSNLQVHQRIQAGEKPYKCSDCDKSFDWRSTLQVHQTIHTGEKPYKCSDCDKSFNRRSVLQVHQMIHTGEKPYKCS